MDPQIYSHKNDPEFYLKVFESYYEKKEDE